MPSAPALRSTGARQALRRHEVLWAGIITGLAGGVAMMIFAMSGAASEGFAASYPLKVIGESFVGPDALDGGVQAAFGALVHFATSALLGVLFASLTPRRHPLTGAMGLGLGFSLLAMGLLMSFVTPWVSPDLRSGFQPIGGAWVLAHAVFGVVVGTAPGLRRWIDREPTPAQDDRGVVRPRAPVAPPRNA